MSDAPVFDESIFDDDSPEVPAAIVDSIASWRRVFAHATPNNLRGILHNAASDLFRSRKIGKTVWPDKDIIVSQAIADALYGLAQSAGINDDEAQLIFAQAQLETPHETAPVPATDVAPSEEPPPPTSPDDYGTAIVTTIDQRPASITPAVFTTPAQWPNEAPPPVDWLAAGRIPRGEVTTLHGDGGAGKTDIALQLAANVARGAPDWLAHQIANGPVVLVSAEEPEREVKRRLWLHAERGGYSFNELADLHQWFPDKTGDAVLAVPDYRTGIMRPTRLMHSLANAIESIAPILVIGDNVAATFAGNQNDRVMVRSYVNLWRLLAHGASRPAVLLLDHPSLSGLRNGTGRSGNMDWRNAVRSALYLRTSDDKAEADLGIRILETVKSNYGPPGNPLRLRWVDGGLRLEHAPNSLHRLAKDAECDETFLRLLDERNAQGRYVVDKFSVSYAPKIFAEMQGNGGFTKQAFARAMDRLFQVSAITLCKYGPPSRGSTRIERAAAVAVAAE